MVSPTPSLFTAGEHSTALPDDSVCNVTRDSHLLQPSYDPDPLPLYCWGSFKGILFLINLTFTATHIIVMLLPAADRQLKGKVLVTTAPGLFAQKADCGEVDVSRAEHEALIRGYT